jgi:hypothetical protein
LVQRGFAAPEAERRVREMADHYEDLREAAMAEGLSEEDAAIRAAEQLGPPTVLADRLAEAARQSRWYGRHRVIAFCLLPAVAHLAIVLLSLLAVALVSQVCLPKATLAALEREPFTPARVMHAKFVIELFCYVAAAGTALLFCGLARRSASGTRWAIAACGVCAVHNYFFHAQASAHALVLGYFVTPGDLMCPVIPLLVAGAVVMRQRRRERGLQVAFSGPQGPRGSRLASLMLLCLASWMVAGCAASKPVHQCGWVGGQYQTANPRALSAKYCFAPSTDRDEVLRAPRAGVMVKEPGGTNSPTSLAGLREGDVIVELGGKPVKRHRRFCRTVAEAKPGTSLSAKVFRAGQIVECPIPVGRETYKNGGVLTVCMPTVVHGWDLWPDPGFSLGALGYEPHLQSVDAHGKPAFVPEWSAWLGVVEVSGGRRIISQETVAPGSL